MLLGTTMGLLAICGISKPFWSLFLAKLLLVGKLISVKTIKQTLKIGDKHKRWQMDNFPKKGRQHCKSWEVWASYAYALLTDVRNVSVLIKVSK